MNHLIACSECGAALDGVRALLRLKSAETAPPPCGMFEEAMRTSQRVRQLRPSGGRFWLGAGFGGAVAASLFAISLMLGVFKDLSAPTGTLAEFSASVSEPRELTIAIETVRALPGATISILLAGGARLDGFGERRSVAWKEDLEPGINKLTLPVRTVDESGGQMVVRLSHRLTERVFVINLKADA